MRLLLMDKEIEERFKLLEKKLDSIEKRYETKRDIVFKIGDVQIQIDEKQNERIEKLERTQITKVFYEQWVDKITKLEKELSELKKTIINNNISFDKEIKELKTLVQTWREAQITSHKHIQMRNTMEANRLNIKELKEQYNKVNQNYEFLYVGITRNQEVLWELIITFQPSLTFSERCGIIFEKELLDKLGGDKSHIGNFSDVEKSKIADDSKLPSMKCDFMGELKNCHNKTIAHKKCFGYENCSGYQHLISDSLEEATPYANGQDKLGGVKDENPCCEFFKSDYCETCPEDMDDCDLVKIGKQLKNPSEQDAGSARQTEKKRWYFKTPRDEGFLDEEFEFAGVKIKPKEVADGNLYICDLCGNEITRVEYEVAKLNVSVEKADLKRMMYGETNTNHEFYIEMKEKYLKGEKE